MNLDLWIEADGTMAGNVRSALFLRLLVRTLILPEISIRGFNLSACSKLLLRFPGYPGRNVIERASMIPSRDYWLGFDVSEVCQSKCKSLSADPVLLGQFRQGPIVP